MTTPALLHDLVRISALRDPGAAALESGPEAMTYARLAHCAGQFANGVLGLGLARGERVGIYLEKRFETVVAMFGASQAGGIAVPINSALKPAQVGHILSDCGVRVLVTSAERLTALLPILSGCPALSHLVVTDTLGEALTTAPAQLHAWGSLESAAPTPAHRVIDADPAAIFYTSGSTGRPKGVVVSHRNLVVGALSVTCYLENSADDALLAALPLSFDAGFSQLTTAFHAGARVVLLNYLMPQDVLRAIDRHHVTGLTAVPPLYIQLARLDWPAGSAASLRYFANTGGHMPREILAALRRRMPAAKPYLMYGLTEAFRSTYLPPEEIERRPDSIGRAIPNAEVLVLRPDGTPCAPEEPGELVHRGALVSLGYWNDPQTTAERFKPLPVAAAPQAGGLPLCEQAVFSGDTVRADSEGFLYFVGRHDDMIKTSGYRVSPTEVEDAVYASGLAAECAAFSIPDPLLGQAIGMAILPLTGVSFNRAMLTKYCRQNLPGYMVPTQWFEFNRPLPRNPNGKIDRNALAASSSIAIGTTDQAN